MDIFANMGHAFAAVLGSTIDLELQDGTSLTLKGIFDPRKVDISIGDNGAKVIDTYPVLDIPRSAIISLLIDPVDLYGATFEKGGQIYSLDAPADDGKSIVRYMCNAAQPD